MIPINITNLTYPSRDLNGLRYVCDMNTAEMINQVDKLPSINFMFLTIAFILLTLYIFWIRTSQNRWVREHLKDFIILPYLALFTATYMYLFVTFTIDTKAFFGILEPVLIGISIILIGHIIYKKYKEAK